MLRSLRMILYLSCVMSSLVHAAEDKIKLLPHQIKPIEYMVNHPEVHGLLIDHYLGTGKTFLAIGFAERFPEFPIVVIGPRFLEGHWLGQMKAFGVANKSRYEFISFNDAPKKLANRDLSKSIVIIDEAHNLMRFLRSTSSEEQREYSDIYLKLKKASRILALSGTPVYHAQNDLAYLLNLVSGEDLLPYNEEEFRLAYTKIDPWKAYGRGYFSESMFLQATIPMFAALLGVAAFGNPIFAVAAYPAVLSLPLVNWLVPIETTDLRYLDVNQFNSFTLKYISYYFPIVREDSDFPTKVIHNRGINYAPWQYSFFIDYAEESLPVESLEKLLSDRDPKPLHEVVKLNSSSIQEQLKRAPGTGREIGNLPENNSPESIASIPKFVEVWKTMESAKFPQTVIYSNYVHNGIGLFAEFLRQKNMDGQFTILSASDNPQTITKIIDDYNSGKIKILLLHPDITEGISLKGTRQMHILEPVMNKTMLDQLVGRTVRYQSHAHLPKEDRNVDIHLWQASVSRLNPKVYLLGKQNWFRRYGELSDWSRWGIGIAQVDENYAFKKYSPDDRVMQNLSRNEKAIQDLNAMMAKWSIETRAD